jgi:hypothetical protein
MKKKAFKSRFTAKILQSEGWWIGFVEEVPGALAQERTKEELIESLKLVTSDILRLKNPEN